MSNEKDEPKVLDHMQDLLFEAPMYVRFRLPNRKLIKDTDLEGFCVTCNRQSVFKTEWRPTPDQWDRVPNPQLFNVTCRCVRGTGTHTAHFQLRFDEDRIMKVGQFPTYADMEIGGTKDLRKLLDRESASELYKAIGLASHGVGIGSFVYVRRIFERVMRRRFEQVKSAEGWQESDWTDRRVAERIDLMKNHLPPFMVKSARLYSILSLGVHELKEKDCLQFFEVARTSILAILEQEQTMKEQEAALEAAERAIRQYQPPGGLSANSDIP